MSTLLGYVEANGMTNGRIESLPASEVDHLLSKFFFLNTRRNNGEEYELATISTFQRTIQRYLTEKKYPFTTLKDIEFEKSRSVLAAKCKSLVHEHGKGTEQATSRVKATGGRIWRVCTFRLFLYKIVLKSCLIQHD